MTIDSPSSSFSYELGEKDDKVLSPCIYQCRLETINKQEMCIACGRTRDEIVNWRDYDDSQKEIVFKLSNQRLLGKLAKN